MITSEDAPGSERPEWPSARAGAEAPALAAYGPSAAAPPTAGITASAAPASPDAVGWRRMLGVALLYPIAIVVATLVGWRAWARGVAAPRVAARVALVVYVTWMLGATLFPIPLGGHLSPSELDPEQRLLDIYNAPNLVPLRGIAETAALGWGWPAVRLLAGNVLVFVPFGFLLPVIWPRFRRGWRTALAGLCFSAAIELSQLSVGLLAGYWYRMLDVDDLLLNVAGVVLGYALFGAFRTWRSWRGARRSEARRTLPPGAERE